MARWPGWWLLVFLVIPAVSGCGTLSNLGRYTGIVVLDGTHTERVYGGVWRDLEFVQDDMAGVVRPGPGLERASQLVGAAYFLLVDLPLSAVGDTLTLPLVLPYVVKEREVFPRRPRIEETKSSALLLREGGEPPASAYGDWDSEAERPAAPVPGGARLPSQP
jgi:uncharacterized protein YceK